MTKTCISKALYQDLKAANTAKRETGAFIIRALNKKGIPGKSEVCREATASAAQATLDRLHTLNPGKRYCMEAAE